MYKDIISYKLANNVSEDHLLKVSERIIKEWMSQQEGFIKWEIHKNLKEDYTDIVYWQSREAAKKAESNMSAIPNAEEWFACYEPGSNQCMNVERIREFK